VWAELKFAERWLVVHKVMPNILGVQVFEQNSGNFIGISTDKVIWNTN
jgi:hypothetical protein